MKKIFIFLAIAPLIAIFIYWKTLTGAAPLQNVEKDYYRVVIMSDVHYPSKTSSEKNTKERQQRINNKLKTADLVNSWRDVDLTVFLGDIVAKTGNTTDYTEAKSYVNRITKPKALITGNHEYTYSDNMNNEKLVKATSAERAVKLDRFKKTFQIDELYYTKNLGKYLLIFLSINAIKSNYSTAISDEELAWFAQTLSANKNKPTIVFFHAPLFGTLENYNEIINTPNYIAQPQDKLNDLLINNAQILIWVSGHTHTKATNPSFNSPINEYGGKILDLHNSTLDGKQIWLNSLYLYPNKIVIRTYDCQNETFMKNFDRTIDTSSFS